MNYTHAEVASLDPQTMRTLCEEYLANNYIDPETSERLGVKRGLRNPDGTGVLAGLTNVCDVVGYKKDQEGHVIPIPGRLIYRGVDINEIVNEAYRMGRAALFRRMPEPPHPDGDESILACPTCGSGEYLYNEDGNRCCFCGWCGQAIDWNAETFKAAGQMKPVLKYPGSKWRLAEWIVSLMPPHKSYLEPFFGSGAVFFKKPPSRIETINDLDGEIINLFRCIREQPEELMRAVACTPYSRGEYEQAWAYFKAGGQVRPDGIEAARLTLVRYWQAHGSTVVYKGGWKNDRAGREYAYDVRYWRQLPERIAAVAERLKDAQIEQAPAVDVIRRFRHPDVLIYADPPYMLHTRKGKQYIVEMAEEAQHVELLDALKEHPGPVILSGYDNDLYNEHLQGWKKLHRRAQAEGGAVRTETVWLNYEPETGGKAYETV